ncbi:MAG: hypothetical protein APF80_09465 [Alphaproteobacteria bacterium BRH_c36]|nr:MAG: hypothetical protein APF80_09465 [Alphaproteobacteria bacterium BRH_c36]
MKEAADFEQISHELMALLHTERQVVPFARRYRSFDLAEAYKVVARVRDLRRAQGEKPIGRKIGFTNRMIWSDLGISAPIWNYVFDTTVSDTADGQNGTMLSGMPEPRIEPELVLHLKSAPALGMTSADLIDCIDWVAPGFELVYSVFPNWEFTAADAAAAFGVHGALVVGERLDITRARTERAVEISTFAVELENDRGVRRKGFAQSVLGGPIEALKFLVEEIARYPDCEPLGPGELVTTGTLTEAMAARSGETWTARYEGIELTPLQLHFD